jgi:septum formation protein
MLGLPVRILPSHADESIHETMPPDQIVETLSLRKAAAAADQESAVHGGVIVASDTIVVMDGTVYGKPASPEDAVRMLRELQGRTHQVYTGLACMELGTSCLTQRVAFDTAAMHHLGDIGRYRILSELDGKPEVIVGYTASQVTFRSMSDVEIRAYVNTGEPSDKAGAYGVQGIGSVFIEKIEGDFYSIMGLPLNLLYQMLIKFGVSPFNPSMSD